jgi:hypothetical protein
MLNVKCPGCKHEYDAMGLLELIGRQLAGPDARASNHYEASNEQFYYLVDCPCGDTFSIPEPPEGGHLMTTIELERAWEQLFTQMPATP